MLPPSGTGREGFCISPSPPCCCIDLTRKMNWSPHPFKKITINSSNPNPITLIPMTHTGPPTCSQMYMQESSSYVLRIKDHQGEELLLDQIKKKSFSLPSLTQPWHFLSSPACAWNPHVLFLSEEGASCKTFINFVNAIFSFFYRRHIIKCVDPYRTSQGAESWRWNCLDLR